MTRLTRRAALALPIAIPAAASAQEGRPGQQARSVVPAAPGGTTDIMARLLAQFLQTRWGTPVVVENRSGGGGTIGTMEVVRSAADGRHMLMGNIGPQAIGYSLFRNLQYRPDSLAAVANVIRGPNVLVLHPSVPARTVPEFVAWLKAQDGRASYGTSGLGQSPHLSGVWFNQLTGTRSEAVHFRGAGPLLIDLVAGNVQFAYDNLTTAIEHIRGGRLRLRYSRWVKGSSSLRPADHTSPTVGWRPPLPGPFWSEDVAAATSQDWPGWVHRCHSSGS